MHNSHITVLLKSTRLSIKTGGYRLIVNMLCRNHLEKLRNIIGQLLRGQSMLLSIGFLFVRCQ